MHISGGSGHFHVSRDPPPPYTANTTYTTKKPREIAVCCVIAHLALHIVCFCSLKLHQSASESVIINWFVSVVWLEP